MKLANRTTSLILLALFLGSVICYSLIASHSNDQRADLPNEWQSKFRRNNKDTYGFWLMQSLNHLRRLDDFAWKKLKSREDVRPFLKLRSSDCSHLWHRRLSAYPIVFDELVPQLQRGHLRFLLGGALKDCVVAKDRVTMFSVHYNSGPALAFHGELTIEDVVEVPFSHFRETLAGLIFHPSSRRPIENLSRFFKAESKIILMRVSQMHNDRQPELPPKSFPKFEVVSEHDVSRWSQRAGKFAIADVRSLAEQQQYPLPREQTVLSVPYTPKDGNVSFDWSKSGAEIIGDSFNTNQIETWLLSNTEGKVILVGTGPQDGRPLWALYRLSIVLTERIVWLYDGISSVAKIDGNRKGQ